MTSPKTYREWWLEEDPKEIGCTQVTFEDPRPPATGWVYHVVEYAAIVAAEAQVDHWRKKYHDLVSYTDHVLLAPDRIVTPVIIEDRTHTSPIKISALESEIKRAEAEVAEWRTKALDVEKPLEDIAKARKE